MGRPKKVLQPTIIQGGLAVDDRGMVSFVNDFDFQGVQRFYMVENHEKQTIRAFHGHQKEGKYVYVVSGSAIVCSAKLDNIKHPRKDILPQRYILSSKSPKVLYIPPMHANGFKPLEKNTKILFFSTSSLQESEQQDDYRYSWNYWGKDIWQVENR